MCPFSTHFARILTLFPPLARQALLAKRLGKKRIIAETGAGQHGVATATACALMGMELTVYMGAEDCRRQSLNVFRMKVGCRVHMAMYNNTWSTTHRPLRERADHARLSQPWRGNTRLDEGGQRPP